MLLVGATAHKAANAEPAWHISLVLSSFWDSAVWRAHSGPLYPFSHSVLPTGDISSLQMRKPVLREVKPPTQFPSTFSLRGRGVVDRNSFRQRSSRLALSVPCENCLFCLAFQGAKKGGSHLLEHPQRQSEGAWGHLLNKYLSSLKPGPGLGSEEERQFTHHSQSEAP